MEKSIHGTQVANIIHAGEIFKGENDDLWKTDYGKIK